MYNKQSEEIVQTIENSFNAVVERHFSQFGQVEDEQEVNTRIEREAMRKFEKIREDQHKRLDAIQAEIDSLMLRAGLIESHQAEVQAIIDVH